MGGNWPPPVTRRRDDELARLDPSAFEALIARHYRGLGYDVERVGHGGRHFDGGIDLKLRRGPEYIVVQCKRENARQVTHNVGHELIGVMCTQGATGAVLVNTGEFTPNARESAARDKRLTLVDGDEVRRWFPELTQPAAEPEWDPVSAGRDQQRRRSRKGRKEGVEALMAVGLLIAVITLQCSRPDPPSLVPASRASAKEAHVGPSPAVPDRRSSAASSATPLDNPAPEPRFEELSPRDLEEWKRKNEESMKILERTTPELGADPRDR